MCSDRFVDGEPTGTHPLPELKLVHEKLQVRREIVKYRVTPKKTKKHIAEETIPTSLPFRTAPHKNEKQNFEFPLEHQYWLLPGCEKYGSCFYKDILIQKYQKSIKCLM